MKKIGILTFQQADNYGAILQAYALKQVLLGLKHQVDIINYDCEAIKKTYQLFFPLSFRPIELLDKLIKFPLRYANKYQFERFRKKYLGNMPLIKADKLALLNDQYDLFIAGSDQIFNLRLTQFDNTFFLPFADIKKSFSYAASFGISFDKLNDQEKVFIRNNLRHFQRISVREAQGVEIVERLAKKVALSHLDPTLLLKKEHWKRFQTSPSQKPYILLYLMHQDISLINFARNLSQRTGYKIKYIPCEVKIRGLRGTKKIMPSISQWVSLFLNAQYVVTNSFHGLAFSINFNKPFFVGRLPEEAATNSRLENLMGLIDQSNRFYTNFIDNRDKPIPWKRINSILDRERQKAFTYLKEITQ